jgi:hypothetical protein
MRGVADAANLATVRRALGTLTLAAVPLLVPHPASGAGEQPATASASSAIPMAEIASRAAELSSLLRSLTPAHSVQIDAIERHLTEMHGRIDEELAIATSLLRGQPTMDTLQA